MRPDPVALCVIRFQRRGRGVAMTVKTSRDVDQRGPNAEYTTLDVEEVLDTVRGLARHVWPAPHRLDGVDEPR
jgi:hypothetical protein